MGPPVTIPRGRRSLIVQVIFPMTPAPGVLILTLRMTILILILKNRTMTTRVTQKAMRNSHGLLARASVSPGCFWNGSHSLRTCLKVTST